MSVEDHHGLPLDYDKPRRAGDTTRRQAPIVLALTSQRFDHYVFSLCNRALARPPIGFRKVMEVQQPAPGLPHDGLGLDLGL